MTAGGGGAEEDKDERLRGGRAPGAWRLTGRFGRRAAGGDEKVFFFYDRVRRGEEAMDDGGRAGDGCI